MSNAIAAPGTSLKVSISTTSAQSAAISASRVHVTPNADCYVREGINPTAVSDGTDHFLLGNATQEFFITPGNKLAFITESGTGFVRIAKVG